MTSLEELIIACYRGAKREDELKRELDARPEAVLGAIEKAVSAEGRGLDVSISPTAYREAVRKFVRDVLWADPRDLYRVLGATVATPQREIRRHYKLLCRLFPVTAGDAQVPSYRSLLKEAYRALRNERNRRLYDQQTGMTSVKNSDGTAKIGASSAAAETSVSSPATSGEVADDEATVLDQGLFKESEPAAGRSTSEARQSAGDADRDHDETLIMRAQENTPVSSAEAGDPPSGSGGRPADSGTGAPASEQPASSKERPSSPDPAAGSPVPEKETAAAVTGQDVRGVRPSTELADLVVAFSQDPDRYKSMMSPITPLPADIRPFLTDLANRVQQLLRDDLMEEPETEETAENTGKREHARQMRTYVKAAMFFISKVFLVPGANHYRVLGLDPDANADQIQEHYRLLRRTFLPVGQGESFRSAIMRISEAYVVLRDPQRRQEYDRKVLGRGDRLHIGSASAEAVAPPSARTLRGPYRGEARRFDLSLVDGFNRRTPKVVSVFLGLILVAATLYFVMSTPTEETQLQGERTLVTQDAVGDGADGQKESTPSAVEPPAVASGPPPSPEVDRSGTSEAEGEGSTPSAGASSPTEKSADELVAALKAFAGRFQDQSDDDTGTTESTSLADTGGTQSAETVSANEPLFPPPEEGVEAEIERLLAKAQQQYDESLYTLPRDNNAYATYQEILALDPDNAAARAGLEKIADRYAQMARYRANRNELEIAESLIKRGLMVVPQHPTLNAMLAELKARMAAALPPPPPLPSDASAGGTPGAAEPATSTPAQSAVPLPTLPSTVAAGDRQDTVAEQSAAGASAGAGESSSAGEPSVAFNAEQLPAESPAAVSRGMSEGELDALVKQFIATYEQGDLESFMSLFAEDAKTNNRDSKSGIRSDYQTLFQNTESRLMRLQNLRWSLGRRSAIGEADFRLTVIKEPQSRPRAYEGRITFQVRETQEGPRIEGLYHSQRNVSR